MWTEIIDCVCVCLLKDFTATIKRPRCNYKPLLVADEGCKKITMKDGSVLVSS